MTLFSYFCGKDAMDMQTTAFIGLLQILSLRVAARAQVQGDNLSLPGFECEPSPVRAQASVRGCTAEDIAVNSNGVPDDCEESAPGDLNSDQLVNVDDLLLMPMGWGLCPSLACPGDITPSGGAGLVNVDDLLALLANWG